jgi:hypothetical protein
VNRFGFGNLRFDAGTCWTAGATGVTSVKLLDGGPRDDHFHPGASVSASKWESRMSIVGEEGSVGEGSSNNVIEKPGMFKLVCELFNTSNFDIVANTYHECSGYQSHNRYANLFERLTNFCDDSSQFEFTQASQVIYQNNNSILPITLKG